MAELLTDLPWATKVSPFLEYVKIVIVYNAMLSGMYDDPCEVVLPAPDEVYHGFGCDTERWHDTFFVSVQLFHLNFLAAEICLQLGR